MVSKKKQRDDAYRAVGRYVVEFSRMIFHMRSALEAELAGSNELIASQLLGKASQELIRTTFFATCKAKADMSREEKQIATHLDKRVRKQISTRNDVAHGDWWIDYTRIDGTTGDPLLWRAGLGKHGRPSKPKELSVAEIDKMADDLYALRQQVTEFGELCLGTWSLNPDPDPPVRVGDIFTFEDGRVRRDGPLARSVGVPKITYI